jgi:hypothetical protein
MMAIQWNDFEEKYLVENLDKLTITELALDMHRSYSSVYVKLKKLGLLNRVSKINKRTQPQRNWTTKEIDFMKENYSKMRIKEIAIKLDRSVTGVGAYATKVLKLKRHL